MYAPVAAEVAGGQMRKATAGTPMPAEAARIRKMMAGRPSLNANARRAPRQDLSGASPDGTIVGRGGNRQQLGAAAMRRLPQQAPPAAPQEMNNMVGGDPGADFGKRVSMPMGGDPGFNGGNSPEMERYFAQKQLGAVSTMGDGMPPGSVTPDMIDKMGQGQAVPQIGGGPGPGAGMVQQPMPGGPDDQARAAAGGSLGLPPQIMQRLSALRGGGMQGGAPGGRPGGFMDFWSAQQGMAR